jgi:hypothetical protein
MATPTAAFIARAVQVGGHGELREDGFSRSTDECGMRQVIVAGVRQFVMLQNVGQASEPRSVVLRTASSGAHGGGWHGLGTAHGDRGGGTELGTAETKGAGPSALTVNDVLNSPMLCDPLHKVDCAWSRTAGDMPIGGRVRLGWRERQDAPPLPVLEPLLADGQVPFVRRPES